MIIFFPSKKNKQENEEGLSSIINTYTCIDLGLGEPIESSSDEDWSSS